jgi:hypothetical protein
VNATEPTQFQKLVLAGLQSKPVYEGTVDPAVKAERRRANRVARKSRKINRRRGAK